MIIKQHTLCKPDGTPINFQATGNIGGVLKAKYLVMHFTAGSNAGSSAAWLRNPKSKASAHMVIGRDGTIIQLVPFNKVAWHAGLSRWESLVGMNQYSIGIELDNAGRVFKRADGKWQNALGVVVQSKDVIEGIHKNEGRPSFWQTYSPVQLEVARDVSALIMAEYKLVDVVGHDDIAPGRKIDPGPAFPMESFRSQIMGRNTVKEELYTNITPLNIRSGPGIEHPTLTTKPLTKGTKMSKLYGQGDWFYVDVKNNTDLEGWVNSKYVKVSVNT